MIVWCLFDGSGIMGKPWADAGHTVYCFNADTADHGQYAMRVEHPNIHYVNKWISPDADFSEYPRPDRIFAFPSCTKLAGSGAQHEREADLIAQDVATARVAESLGNRYGCSWMVENPVGKLSTYWRKPNFYFDPYQFGGYLSPDEPTYHPKMPAQDAYTKKTCIWCGNGFIKPTPRPVPHIGVFWGWAYLGGKSERTKQLRSLTPRGYAQAVFEANKR